MSLPDDASPRPRPTSPDAEPAAYWAANSPGPLDESAAKRKRAALIMLAFAVFTAIVSTVAIAVAPDAATVSRVGGTGRMYESGNLWFIGYLSPVLLLALAWLVRFQPKQVPERHIRWYVLLAPTIALLVTAIFVFEVLA